MKRHFIRFLPLILLLLAITPGCEEESPEEPQDSDRLYPSLHIHSNLPSSPDQVGWTYVGMNLLATDDNEILFDPTATITLDGSDTLEYFPDPTTWPKYGQSYEFAFEPESEHRFHIESLLGEAEDLLVAMPAEISIIEIDTTDLYPGDLVNLNWTTDPEAVRYDVTVNGVDRGDLSNSDPWVQLQWYPDSSFVVQITTIRESYQQMVPVDSIRVAAVTSIGQEFQVNW